MGRGSVGKGNAAEGHAYVMTPPALHANAPGTNEDAASLTADQVQPLLSEAIARWQQLPALTQPGSPIDIRIANLGGTTLALVSGNSITLDDNAAGWGWFIDRTPRSDSEFTRPGNQGEQNRMDLLSVLMHEIGHVLGHEHDEGGVMQETLAAGQRLGLDALSVEGIDWGSKKKTSFVN